MDPAAHPFLSIWAVFGLTEEPATRAGTAAPSVTIVQFYVSDERKSDELNQYGVLTMKFFLDALSHIVAIRKDNTFHKN